MKKQILIAFLVFSMSVLAQPTINASDINSVVGDVNALRYPTQGFSDSLDPGLPGANQNWIFNASLSPGIRSFYSISPSSAPNNNLFPSATIVSKLSFPNGYSIYSYYKQNNDSSVYIGGLSTFSGSSSITSFSNPYVEWNYPITYLSTNFDVSVSSSTLEIVTTRTHSINDAYGTLTVNGNTYIDVIRKHDFDTTTSVNNGVVTVEYSENYYWQSAADKFPLFALFISKTGLNGTVSKSTYVNNITVSGFNGISAITDLNVSPNPVINEMVVSGENIDKASYVIKDVAGKTIRSGNLDVSNRKINVENIEKGVYFLQLNNNSKTIIKKFVKQ
jgi:Secretion system C-terminal sorting domain